MSEDVERTALADQAHAELEACLRAAADVHGASIEVYWVDTGSKALLTVSFDSGASRWLRLSRCRLLAAAFGASLAAASVASPAQAQEAAWALSASIAACGALHLWCTRRLARTKVAEIGEVVRTAAGMSDLFDIDAEWSAERGVWEIGWARRYPS